MIIFFLFIKRSHDLYLDFLNDKKRAMRFTIRQKKKKVLFSRFEISVYFRVNNSIDSLIVIESQAMCP